MSEKTPQSVYDEFWKQLVEDDRGTLVKEKVIKELFDFANCLDNWSTTLYHLTGGKLSNANYTADIMIQEVESYFTKAKDIGGCG